MYVLQSLLLVFIASCSIDFGYSWKQIKPLHLPCTPSQNNHRQQRRIVLGTSIALANFMFAWNGPTYLSQPPEAFARNLPQSNGASGGNRGQPSSLVPILKMKQTVDAALQQTGDLAACGKLLHQLPSKETEFKKLFDEHSEGISYKQVFMDQNGFLVYYTQGFDGAGRPSIEQEDDSTKREKAQFGARNDAWVSVDEAVSEVDYLLQNPTDTDPSDLQKSLRLATKALADYVALDDAEVVRAATNLLSQ
jgi:hypothetical protein